MKKWLLRLIGGRPMKLLFRNYFVDSVTNQPVHLYRDRLGTDWMALNKWSTFRVQAMKVTQSYLNYLKGGS